MPDHPLRREGRSSSCPPFPLPDSRARSRFHYLLTSSEHISPDGLQYLLKHNRHDGNPRTAYHTSLYTKYWKKPNGAVTDGVLHLAYSPDATLDEESTVPPDVVRAEYERISAVIDWLVGERGSSGAALVVYGEPGCGKSRFLHVERGRLFEAGQPCIVTNTRRSTFDYYCDAGPFFDIPLRELPCLDLLVPTVALVDTAVGFDALQHNLVDCLIADVVIVFATSPKNRRLHKLSDRLSPALYWVLDLWSDTEITALKTLVHLQPPMSWLNSPKVHLRLADRALHRTHLPPPSQILPPPAPNTVNPLCHSIRIKPAYDEREPQPPPSDFLPEVIARYRLPVTAYVSYADNVPAAFRTPTFIRPAPGVARPSYGFPETISVPAPAPLTQSDE